MEVYYICLYNKKDMRAFEIILNEDQKIIGSLEIDPGSLVKVENGWKQGDVFLPSSKIILQP